MTYNIQVQNCMKQSVPVRVVRGHQSKSSYVGKVYTYDGLYQVIDSKFILAIFFLCYSVSFFNFLIFAFCIVVAKLRSCFSHVWLGKYEYATVVTFKWSFLPFSLVWQ